MPEIITIKVERTSNDKSDRKSFYTIKQIQCDLCERICHSNSQYNTHVKSVHNKIKDINCQIPFVQQGQDCR